MTAKLRLKKTEADTRVGELGLDPKMLIEVVTVAVGAAYDSTPDDPLNAPGTLSYIYGTRALRERFCVEGGWQTDRRNGVESIYHPEKDIRVIFQNVDWASDPYRAPKPRSRKGPGSERASSGNQLYLDLPEPPSPPDTAREGRAMTFFLMVSHDGEDVRAELSQPIVKDGKFDTFIERNFLIRAGEWSSISVGHGEEEERDDDLDIEVVRKK